LGDLVEDSNSFAGRRHHRSALARLCGSSPGMDGDDRHLAGGPTLAAIVAVVECDDGGGALAESEAGVSFPGRVEAVDAVELDGADGVDEVAEHARPPDGSELQRVTDQGEPPPTSLSEVDQLGQAWRRDHRGFVD